MANVHIKSGERREAEAAALREFGLDARTANAEQREMAAQVTADNSRAAKELNRMEEKSR